MEQKSLYEKAKAFKLKTITGVQVFAIKRPEGDFLIKLEGTDGKVMLESIGNLRESKGFKDSMIIDLDGRLNEAEILLYTFDNINWYKPGESPSESEEDIEEECCSGCCEDCQESFSVDLKDTAELMLSEDYRDRFIAEYFQVKIRLEKIHKTIIKARAGTLSFKLSCPVSILESQERAMTAYFKILEIRAELEKIFE